MRVQSSRMRVFSVDGYIFRMKFPTGFIHILIYTASCGFPATARLLFFFASVVFLFSHVWLCCCMTFLKLFIVCPVLVNKVVWRRNDDNHHIMDELSVCLCVTACVSVSPSVCHPIAPSVMYGRDHHRPHCWPLLSMTVCPNALLYPPHPFPKLISKT